VIATNNFYMSNQLVTDRSTQSPVLGASGYTRQATGQTGRACRLKSNITICFLIVIINIMEIHSSKAVGLCCGVSLCIKVRFL